MNLLLAAARLLGALPAFLVVTIARFLVPVLLTGVPLALAGCTSDLSESLDSQSTVTGDAGLAPAQEPAPVADVCPAGSYATVSLDGEGQECLPCDVGTYCAEGATEPHPCVAGTWDEDADPGSRCEPWTHCAAGSYVLEQGSPGRDRTCAPCEPNAFSVEPNAPECAPYETCDVGSYVRVAGTASGDQVCATCPEGTFSAEPNRTECSEWTECVPGEYVERLGSGIEDQTCAPCPEGQSSSSPNATGCVENSACRAGTVETLPATTTQPAECEACEPGVYCAGSTSPALACGATQWDHDTEPATPCVPHATCAAGTHISSPGTALSDQQCEPCPGGTFSATLDAANCQDHQSCAAGTFVQAPGTATSDNECSGCPSGSYSAEAGSSGCSAWTDCQPGEFVALVGSATVDRQCEPCALGTFSEALNSGSCVEAGECAPGTVELVPSSEASPAECEACEPGEYCAGSGAPAVACLDDTWDDDLNPATPCAAKTVCAPGESVIAPGDATNDRSCLACAAGQWSDASNAESCQVWQVCAPGSYVATPGTSTADQLCSACAAGTFSAVDDAPNCTAWSTCEAPSFYMTNAPSSTSDRQCPTCEAPEVTQLDNETECRLLAFQMSGGSVVMEAEHFHVQDLNGSSHSWQTVAEVAASGGQCMDVNPDVGYTWTSPVGFAPRLQFRVDFATAGTFYVHLRGDPGSSGAGSDSVFAAVDDTLLAEYDFDDQAGAWGWRQQSITVAAAGRHTVSIWAREDGLCIDKIVVSTSATAPTGNGPAESPQD